MANFNLNKVILGGRITHDLELKATQSGLSVCTFTIAVNRKTSSANGDKQVDFINCVAWRQTAEFICKYFRKGSSICIVGNIQTRSYDDRNGQKRVATEIIVDEANFVDSKNDNASTAAQPQTWGNDYVPDAYKPKESPTMSEIEDDEWQIPF